MTDAGGFVMDRRPSAGLGCQAVDQVGVETGPEAVVYVDDGNTVGAGIHHGEQGGYPAEIGSIAHAGRHGYHRNLYQACQHAGESSFHARHGHQRSSLADGVQMGNQAVQAGHAAVPVPDYPAAQKFRCQGGLLRYVLVRGPRADDADEARRSRNRDSEPNAP